MTSVAYLDVGPTQDFSVGTRPGTDNVIDFEDLVVFAINFGAGPAPPTLASRQADRSGATSTGDRLLVDAPLQVTAGQEFAVRLKLEGSGRIQALSAALAWAGDIAEPLSVEAGTWLSELDGIMLSPRHGTADVALLGVRESGFAGSGEVAIVRFRAKSAGAPAIGIGALKARDAVNRNVEVATSVLHTAPAAPTVTALEAAYPNPFRDATHLALSLARAGQMSVVVFGVDGRAVRTLAGGRWEPGVYRLDWDGRDDDGRPVAAGVYFVRMTTAHATTTRRVALVR
jgi:hypothetical protein